MERGRDDARTAVRRGLKVPPSAGRDRRVEGGAAEPTPLAGFRVIVPGHAQWWRGQRERGTVLFGSFAAAGVVSLFTWGTATGYVLLGFVYLTHVVSTTDALSQEAFYPEGRWARRLSVALGLGLGAYLPVLLVAMLFAWPGVRGGAGVESYLVDRSAYRHAEPRNDDRVWYRPANGGEPRVGRVVAGRGAEVEWSNDVLRVNGRPVSNVGTPFTDSRTPRRIAYRVPDGHVLVAPEGEPAAGVRSEGWVIVSRDQIVGRAWAQYYPIRDRQLLISRQRPGQSDQS